MADINIHRTLNNAAPEAILGRANQIKDTRLNKNQEDINKEFEENKQDNLVSGNNIKTVGGQSIVGSGNVKAVVADITQSFTEEEKQQIQQNIGTSESTLFKGQFNDLNELKSFYPTAEKGNYAFVGSPRHLFIYDVNTAKWLDKGAFKYIEPVQETGDSIEDVMSQKVVTAKLSELENKKINVSDFPIKDVEKEGAFFTDEKGNVWMRFIPKLGLDVAKVSESMASKILAFLSIVQDIGDSEKSIISQKGVTLALKKLSEDKTIEIENSISEFLFDTEEDGVFFCNEIGEVFARYKNGVFEAIGLKKDVISKDVISKFDSAFASELLNPNDSLTLTDIPDIKNHYSIGASFQINEMGTIKIFKSKTTYARGEIDIDSTHIKDYLTDEKQDTYEHGLQLDKGCIVRIDIIDAGNRFITLIDSSGNIFKQKLGRFNGCKGNIVSIENISGSYKNVSISFSGDWFKKDTWIFGDSYTDYWTYRASENGWTNYALDGFSGRNSEQAYNSLLLELKYGKPKRIVWMMGMNDADNEDSVNSNWLKYYNIVHQLCVDNNIQFIPCTIPNVPIRTHTFKNNIIRESGLPYIDIAFAVGANDKGSSWYEGLLGEDNVHPTNNKGAAVIAGALAAGVPDIALQ